MNFGLDNGVKYNHQGFVLELGANVGEPGEETLDTVKREEIDYAGFFKLRNIEDATTDTDGYVTYCVPTTGEIVPNKYTEFLQAYNLRMPISIKGLERALGLTELVNVENPSPFDGLLWIFFYRTPENCIIRLYGRDLSYENNVDKYVARNRRGEFLFTGYWVVGCSE